MALGRANVCPHHFGREEIAHAALDGLAFQGIITIRSPETVGALENFKIDPTAARCAGLYFHIRMRQTQAVHQPINGEGLTIDGRPALMARLH